MTILGSNEKTYKKEAQQFLKHILTKNVHNKRVSVTLEFSVGKIQDQIMRMIEIYAPSLLIVGTRGRSSKGWRGLLPGSVSKWCLTYVPIPVVVVKPLSLRQKEQLERERKALKGIKSSKSSKKNASGEEISSYALHHKSYMEMLLESTQFANLADAMNSDPVLTVTAPVEGSMTARKKALSTPKPNQFKEQDGRRIYFSDASSKNLHPKLPHHLTQRNSEIEQKDGSYSFGSGLSRSRNGSAANLTQTFGSLSSPAVNTVGLDSKKSDSLPTSPFMGGKTSSSFRSSLARSPMDSPRYSPKSSPLLSPSLRPGMGERKISRLDLLRSKSPHP